METKYEEYQHCKARGHDADMWLTVGKITKGRCRFCGTYFWDEVIKHEDEVPEPPDLDEKGQ